MSLLVTKGSAVQKIASGQTFIDILNLRCDFEHEYSNPVLSQDTLAYDGDSIKLSLVAKGSALPKIQQKELYFDYICHCCDCDLEVSTPILLHDTPPHDDAAPYQVWL